MAGETIQYTFTGDVTSLSEATKSAINLLSSIGKKFEAVSKAGQLSGAKSSIVNFTGALKHVNSQAADLQATLKKVGDVKLNVNSNDVERIDHLLVQLQDVQKHLNDMTAGGGQLVTADFNLMATALRKANYAMAGLEQSAAATKGSVSDLIDTVKENAKELVPDVVKDTLNLKPEIDEKLQDLGQLDDKQIVDTNEEVQELVQSVQELQDECEDLGHIHVSPQIDSTPISAAAASAQEAAQWMDTWDEKLDEFNGDVQRTADYMAATQGGMEDTGFDDAFDDATESANNFKDTLHSIIGIAGQVISTAKSVGAAFADAIDFALGPFNEAFNFVYKAMRKLALTFTRILRGKIVRGLFKNFSNTLIDLGKHSTEAAEALNSIKASSLYVQASITASLSPALEWLSATFQNITNKIVAFIQQIGYMIAIFTGKNTVTQAIRPEVGATASIPGYASGTTNSADTFIAGENGPELVVGAAGSTVYTAGQTASMFAASSNSAEEIAEYTSDVDRNMNAIVDSAKELDDILTSIDELHILNQKQSGGGGGGADIGMGVGFEDVEIPDNWFTRFITDLKKAIDSGDWSSVGELLAKKFEDAIDYIDEHFSWSKVQKSVEKWASKLQNVTNSLIANTPWEKTGKTFGDSLTSMFNTMTFTFKGINWKGLGKGIGDSINGFFKSGALSSFVDAGFTIIHSLWQAVLNAFDSVDWGEVAGQIGDALEKPAMWQEAFKTVFDTIETVGRTYIFELAPRLIPETIELAWAIVEGFGKAVIQKIVEWGQKIADFFNVGDWYREHIYDPLNNWLGLTEQRTDKSFAKQVTAQDAMLEKTTETFAEFIAKSRGLTEGVSAESDKLSRKIATSLGDIDINSRSAWASIHSNAYMSAANTQSSVNTKFEIMRQKIAFIMGNITNTVGTGFDGLAPAAAPGFGSLLAKVDAWMSNLWSTVSDWVSSIIAQISSIGSAIGGTTVDTGGFSGAGGTIGQSKQGEKQAASNLDGGGNGTYIRGKHTEKDRGLRGGVGTTVQVQKNGKAPPGLAVGTNVQTAGGVYVITGVNADGSYTSSKVGLATGGVVSSATHALIGEGRYSEAVIPLEDSPQMTQLVQRIADAVSNVNHETEVKVYIGQTEFDAFTYKATTRGKQRVGFQPIRVGG